MLMYGLFPSLFPFLPKQDLRSYKLLPNFSFLFYGSVPEATWQFCWNWANASQMITHRVVCLLFSRSKHPWLREIVLCCAKSTFCPNACGFPILPYPSTAVWDSLLLSLPPLPQEKSPLLKILLILLAKWFSWRVGALSFFSSLYSLYLVKMWCFVQKEAQNKCLTYFNEFLLLDMKGWGIIFLPNFFSISQNSWWGAKRIQDSLRFKRLILSMYAWRSPG